MKPHKQIDGVEQNNAKRCEKTTTISFMGIDEDGKETIIIETIERCVEIK